MEEGVFPDIDNVEFTGTSWDYGSASFVMRSIESGNATTLTFESDSGLSVPMPSTRLEPGSIEGAIEVFRPGNYLLEVRVPGFPLQQKAVTIEPKKWNTITVHLEGI